MTYRQSETYSRKIPQKLTIYIYMSERVPISAYIYIYIYILYIYILLLLLLLLHIMSERVPISA